MKRFSLAIMALAIMGLMTMASCKKSNGIEDNTVAPRTMTFRATTEMGENKTSLNGLNVNWNEGDKLSVNGELFTLSAGAGTTFGSFKSDEEVTITAPYYAAYPASATYNAGTLTFNLTAEPAYNPSSIDIPMVAIDNSELGTLSFKNVVNVLHLQLTGDDSEASKLTSIMLTSTTSNLNGNFTVTFSGDTPIVSAANGTQSTTLTFDAPLQLTSEKKDVYIVLPKIVGGDLKIRLNCANGLFMRQTIGVTGYSQFGGVNNMFTPDAFLVDATTLPPAAPRSVTTSVGCSGSIYSMGGTVELGAAQEVEYGFVCSESVGEPMVGAANCFKVVGGVADFPAGTTDFNVDITGLTVGQPYFVRAYAIGENLTVVHGSVKTVTGGDTPQAIPSNWNGGGTPGASPYLFTVYDPTPSSPNSGDETKIRFSRGNLQYVGGTGTWKFADHQFDFLGNTTDQNSATETVDRDLFGWGTSGYHQTSPTEDTYNTNYMPYSTLSTTVNETYNYYGYGPSTNMIPEGPSGLDRTAGNINNSYYDWGVYNTIYAGGTATTGWRTLTTDEWRYLLGAANNSKWALGKVGNCTCGMIILPDDWTSCPTGCNFTGGVKDFTTNVYSYTQWHDMESAGAVFLPAAGDRDGTALDGLGFLLRYWSSSCGGSNYAFCIFIKSDNVNPQGYGSRYVGRSVRLVR